MVQALAFFQLLSLPTELFLTSCFVDGHLRRLVLLVFRCFVIKPGQLP